MINKVIYISIQLQQHHHHLISSHNIITSLPSNLILPRPTSLSMMLMPPMIKPRHKPRALRIPLANRRIRPRNPLKAQRILGHRVGNALGVEEVRVFS
jgi:hypothetical protein